MATRRHACPLQDAGACVAVSTPALDLEDRIAALERDWLRISKMSLMRLQKGDIVVMRVKRPIASSEREAVIQAWRDLMAKVGIEGVELMVVAGAQVDISVMRQK